MTSERADDFITQKHRAYLAAFEGEIIRELVQSLRSLMDYQFAVNDLTGQLVKQHCTDALERFEDSKK